MHLCIINERDGLNSYPRFLFSDQGRIVENCLAILKYKRSYRLRPIWGSSESFPAIIHRGSSIPLYKTTAKARFRRRTFHEPNLIRHWIKYMKSSASESIGNACFSLERLSRSFRLARPGISPLDRLWNAFDSDAELFMYRTKCRNSYNVFCKQFDRNAHFSPSEFSSAGNKIGVWITLAGLNNLGRC